MPNNSIAEFENLVDAYIESVNKIEQNRDNPEVKGEIEGLREARYNALEGIFNYTRGNYLLKTEYKRVKGFEYYKYKKIAEELNKLKEQLLALKKEGFNLEDITTFYKSGLKLEQVQNYLQNDIEEGKKIIDGFNEDVKEAIKIMAMSKKERQELEFGDENDVGFKLKEAGKKVPLISISLKNGIKFNFKTTPKSRMSRVLNEHIVSFDRDITKLDSDKSTQYQMAIANAMRGFSTLADKTYDKIIAEVKYNVGNSNRYLASLEDDLSQKVVFGGMVRGQLIDRDLEETARSLETIADEYMNTILKSPLGNSIDTQVIKDFAYKEENWKLTQQSGLENRLIVRKALLDLVEERTKSPQEKDVVIQKLSSKELEAKKLQKMKKHLKENTDSVLYERVAQKAVEEVKQQKLALKKAEDSKLDAMKKAISEANDWAIQQGENQKVAKSLSEALTFYETLKPSNPHSPNNLKSGETKLQTWQNCEGSYVNVTSVVGSAPTKKTVDAGKKSKALKAAYEALGEVRNDKNTNLKNVFTESVDAVVESKNANLSPFIKKYKPNVTRETVVKGYSEELISKLAEKGFSENVAKSYVEASKTFATEGINIGLLAKQAHDIGITI